MVSGFVDSHVHLPLKEYLSEAGGDFHKAAAHMFGTAIEPLTAEQTLKEYDQSNVEKLIVLGWDAETETGLPRVPNELVAEFVNYNPERMIGFAGVDPRKGKMALIELEHAVKDLGLKGLKLHPIAQGFVPSDNQFFPLYEKCVELGLPIIFHAGTTGWGRALPGGNGAKLHYANPIHLDSVAADFPKLKIIMAHPAHPWVEVQVAVVAHKANVFADLSGYSPKYFGETIVLHMSKLQPNKFMFGTDYPFLRPAKWLKDFETLNLSQDVKMKILRDNAVNIFGLK